MKFDTSIPVIARASIEYAPIEGPNGERGEEFEAQAKEELLPKIAEMVGKPVTANDVHVFKARVINTKLIAFGGKFNPKSLNEAVALMPGAPLMIEHNYDTAPIGKHFDAKTRYIDSPDARDENYWGEAYLYVPANDPEGDAIYKRVGLKIYDQSSAAWAFLKMGCSVCGQDMRMCGHYPMQVYDPGGLAYFNMDGIQKYYESSIVFQGAAQGTHMVLPETQTAADLPEEYRERMKAFRTASASGVSWQPDGHGGLRLMFADDGNPIVRFQASDRIGESRRYRAWVEAVAREYGGVQFVEDIFRAKHEATEERAHTGCTCGVENGVAQGKFVVREEHDNCHVTVLQCEECEGFSVGWTKPNHETMGTVATPQVAAAEARVVPPGNYESVEAMLLAVEKSVAAEAETARTTRNADSGPPMSVKRNVQCVACPTDRFAKASDASAWVRWRGFLGNNMEQTADAFLFHQWDASMIQGDPKTISLEPSRKTNPVTAVVAMMKSTDKSTETASTSSEAKDDGVATLFS